MHLADYMDERHLSDETVAAAIGRSRVSVSRYRRKLVRPDWETINAIRAYTKGRVAEADWSKVKEIGVAESRQRPISRKRAA